MGTAGTQDFEGRQVARFGAFELFLDTGELRKHGVRVRLQGKPFHILKALVEEPGHVVTRDELRTRLWPVNTFVDFESGLNTAVNRLRLAIGDSAENPIYIETLARLGYRFIAPVERLNLSNQPRPASAVPAEKPESRNTELDAENSPSTTTSENSPRIRIRVFIGGAAIIMLALVAASTLIPEIRPRPGPVFHRITFRKGLVEDARFNTEGASVTYSAQWNGQPSKVFATDVANPEAHDLGFENAWLASLSPTAEMAVFIKSKNTGKMILERAPLHGGAPRVISDRAQSADWAPDGKLCLVTQANSTWSLEFPPGRIIYTSSGWITSPRVSPHGDEIAFLDHPVPGDDAGQVVVVNSRREARVLSSGWASARGLAWHPKAREVWFTATRSGANRALMAVDLRGRLRKIAAIPGDLQIKDITRSGNVLVARSTQHMIMAMGKLNEHSERDISWLDWSHAVAITPDGASVLFDESGEGGGKKYSVYLYRADTRSSQRLGEGRAVDLSEDGQWAITQSADDPTSLTLVSARGSPAKSISAHGITYRWVKFLPGGKEILFAGKYPNQNRGIYRQRLSESDPILVKPNLDFENVVLDRSGRTVVGCDGSRLLVLDLSNGSVTFISTPQCVSPVVFVDRETVLTTSHDGKSIGLDLLNLASGKLTPYAHYEPDNLTGGENFFPLYIARDLQTFVYSRLQTMSDLFVVSGWK